MSAMFKIFCGLIKIILRLIFIYSIVFTSLSLARENEKYPRQWQVDGALAALQDSDPKVQALALDALVKLSRLDTLGKFVTLTDGHKPLLEALSKNSDASVQKSAIAAMGVVGEKTLPILLKLLRDEDSDVRRKATEAIGRIGEAGKVYNPELAKLLSDEDSYVRMSAAEAIGNMGKAGNAYLPELAKLLSDEDSDVRSNAAEAIGNMREAGKAYLPELVKLLSDEDSDVRSSAAEAIGNMREAGKVYTPELVKLLKDEDPFVSSSAAAAIGRIGEAGKVYLPELAKLLKDEGSYVRMSAAEAIGNMGKAGNAYLPELAKLLSNEDFDVRMSAAAAIGRIGEAGNEYLPELVKLLKDEGTYVRVNAVWVIGDMGAGGKKYLPELAKLLSDENSAVRMSAAATIGNMGEAGNEYIPELAKLLSDEDPDVRGTAAAAIGQMGEAAKEYLPDIIKLLSEQDGNIREIVIEILISQTRVDLQLTLLIIEQTGKIHPSDIPQIRFTGYITGGGNREVNTLLQWLGKPNLTWLKQSNSLSLEEAQFTLRLFDRVWSMCDTLAIQTELANQSERLVSADVVRYLWQENDFEYLSSLAGKLSDAGYPNKAGTLRDVLKDNGEFWKHYYSLKRWIINNGWIVLLSHLLLWCVLIFFYPHSQAAQTFIFWNPWARRIMGFGYVGLALTYIPFLRRKLFRPFEKSLRADAGLTEFEEESYFPESYVKKKKSGENAPIFEIIPEIKG